MGGGLRCLEWLLFKHACSFPAPDFRGHVSSGDLAQNATYQSRHRHTLLPCGCWPGQMGRRCSTDFKGPVSTSGKAELLSVLAAWPTGLCLKSPGIWARKKKLTNSQKNALADYATEKFYKSKLKRGRLKEFQSCLQTFWLWNWSYKKKAVRCSEQVRYGIELI